MTTTQQQWPILSLSEVQKHSSPEDLWMIVFGKVYDTTKLLLIHPGGAEVLLDCAGVDATEAFVDVGHSQDAIDMLIPYQVGVIEGCSDEISTSPSSSDTTKKMKLARKRRIWKLVKKFNSSWKADNHYRVSIIFYSFLAILAFALILLLQRQQWVKITS